MKKRLCSLPTAARTGRKQGWRDERSVGFRKGVPKGTCIEFGLLREGSACQSSPALQSNARYRAWPGERARTPSPAEALQWKQPSLWLGVPSLPACLNQGV